MGHYCPIHPISVPIPAPLNQAQTQMIQNQHHDSDIAVTPI